MRANQTQYQMILAMQQWGQNVGGALNDLRGAVSALIKAQQDHSGAHDASTKLAHMQKDLNQQTGDLIMDHAARIQALEQVIENNQRRIH